VNQELVDYIQDLRRKGISCILATDNEKYRFQHMLINFGFDSIFDKAYSSADLGCKKLNRDFFEKIISELDNISKKEILFIDDDIENIQIAEKFGIHTHVYISMENLKEKFNILNRK
jgi:putative hydrolase of the HAD superfamily